MCCDDAHGDSVRHLTHQQMVQVQSNASEGGREERKKKLRESFNRVQESIKCGVTDSMDRVCMCV